MPINLCGVHWVAGKVNIVDKTITIYNQALILFTDDEILTYMHPLCVLMPRFSIYYLDFYVNNRGVNISLNIYRFVRI